MLHQVLLLFYTMNVAALLLTCKTEVFVTFNTDRTILALTLNLTVTLSPNYSARRHCWQLCTVHGECAQTCSCTVIYYWNTHTSSFPGLCSHPQTHCTHIVHITLTHHCCLLAPPTNDLLITGPSHLLSAVIAEEVGAFSMCSVPLKSNSTPRILPKLIAIVLIILPPSLPNAPCTKQDRIHVT